MNFKFLKYQSSDHHKYDRKAPEIYGISYVVKEGSRAHKSISVTFDNITDRIEPYDETSGLSDVVDIPENGRRPHTDLQ